MPVFLVPRSARPSGFKFRCSSATRPALLAALTLSCACGSSPGGMTAGAAGAGIVTQPTAGTAAPGSTSGTGTGSAGVSAQAGVGPIGVGTGQAGSLATAGAAASAGASGSSAVGGSAGLNGGSGASGASGNSGTAGTTAGAAGGSAGSGAGTAGAGGASSSTGTFPAITDPNTMGPYATSTKTGAGPKGDGTIYYPTAFGPNGLKNPIFVWDPGSGISGTMYATLLTHLASHGFVAYACSASSASGSEVKDGIDWMIAQNTASGSIFNGKLDTTKVAAGGHSLGSIATFANATDARLTTTIHVSGGTMDSTHAAIATLKYPVLYVCGETCTSGQTGLTDCDLAAPNCTADYGLTKVPVFYGQNTTASHAFGWQMDYGALTAWLRWYLMGDTTQKPEFLGSDCVLCKQPWVGMSKGLQ